MHRVLPGEAVKKLPIAMGRIPPEGLGKATKANKGAIPAQARPLRKEVYHGELIQDTTPMTQRH